MRSSDSILCLGLLLAGGTAGVLHADNLTLSGEARLTGTVRSIDETGVIRLASPLSPDPIQLKPGAVAKVEFSAPETLPNPPETLVELTNGDLLPVTIEGLDDRNLSVTTADAGPLSIPREAVKSMQVGVRKPKIIYTGPRNMEEWTREGEGGRSWAFSNHELVASGPAEISKSFETPLQFVFKFTLKWQAMPGFQIYFADPLVPDSDLSDRYYMQFNGAGLEIKRESSEGKHFQTVIALNRTPDQFPDNQLEIEIHVDRKTSHLHLLLNGEPEAAGVDPVPDPPKGNGIRLVNSSPPGTTQEIRDIVISEFDNAGKRHHAENRGDPKTDSLISRDEDRWGGHLTGIRKGPEGTVFSFKSDFQEAPLELAEADVSTIFFAKTAADTGPGQNHPFALRLCGDGLLKVSSCVFSEDAATAVHPLLGPLKINRNGIAALERTDSKPPAKADE